MVERVSSYVSRSRELIKESPQMDEANTKVRLVQPFIEILGWDPYSAQVELEYPVKMGRGTKKVDYALMLEGTPAIFIEAKGCDSTLSDSDRNQLKSYLRLVGVDWGVLTNGKKFEIFKRVPNSKRPDEVNLGSFGVDELSDEHPLLKALCKNSIKSGEAERIAENVERIQRSISKLQKHKEKVANEVVNVVTQEIGKSIPVKIEDNAKEFVDNLIGSLQSHGPSASAKISNEQRKAPLTSDQFWEEVESKLGIKQDESGMVRFNEEHNGKENYLNFIKLMFDEGYIKKSNLPFKLSDRADRYILNHSPQHSDGSDMYQPYEIFEGVFVETHNSTSDKKRYMKNLVSEFVED